MATKKRKFPSLVIERMCPKCGTVTTYSLMNIKEIRLARKINEEGNETITEPHAIYRCNICGNTITK